MELTSEPFFLWYLMLIFILAKMDKKYKHETYFK